MGLVRGRELVPVRAALKEAFGDAGWRRLLAELPPPDRAVLDGLLVPDNWYERKLHTRMIENAYRLYRAEMPGLGRRIGARVAEHHDRFYFRPLLAAGGVMMVVRRASAIYREYFQGGALSVIEQRDHGARLALDDPEAAEWLCQETMPGFVEALIQLAGRTPVRVATPVCRHRGDATTQCEIDVEWR
jgi:hypothetical protein